MATSSAKSVKKRPEKPRYLQLADELRDDILSGALNPKDQFPTESALCRQHGVSRFTVREALRKLQTEGLIQRRRGSGTVIQPAAARGGALHQPLSNVGEILQYARDTRFVFTREQRCAIPKKIAEQIAGETGGRWFRFRGRRLGRDDDKPLAVTDAYVHPDFEAAAGHIQLSQTTIFRQLEELAGVEVARITQDIQAVAASAEIAGALDISRRSPCLRILRCYVDDEGRVFEISVSHHPGDRFIYSMHIEADT